MWFVLFCAIVILLILKNYYNSIRAVILMWNVDGPPSLPILGNAHYFIGKNLSEIFDTLFGFAAKYGPYFKFWLGSDLKVVIQDPNDIEIILSSSRYIEKSRDYQFFRSWLDDGILTSTGKKWKDRRRAVEQGFRLKLIEKSVDAFDRMGNTVVEQLLENGPNKSVELLHFTKRYTLDVLCESVMGISINTLNDPNSDYIKAIHDVTAIAYHRIMNLFFRNPFIFKFSKLYQQDKNATHVIHSFVDNVIITRRQELIKQMTNDESTKPNEITNDRKNRALLDTLLQTEINGELLTDMDIREEINSFIFAGHHGISVGILLFFYNIAKYPWVQRKCYDEMVNVFGTDKKSPTTIPLLNQLVYLEQVIKESMRLFSSVPVIARLATEDIKLTKNRFIPKGSTVLIPFYTIFRNPDYFEDPLEFKPERFSEENLSERKHAFIYIPFSAGPRSCIGQRYAMYELKTIVTKILRTFEISLKSGCEQHPIFNLDIVLQPAKPIKFYFKPRI